MKIRCYNFAKDLVQKYKLKTATTKRSFKKNLEEILRGALKLVYRRSTNKMSYIENFENWHFYVVGKFRV